MYSQSKLKNIIHKSVINSKTLKKKNTCLSGRDLKTNPTVLWNSCEPKRPKRDVPPEAATFSCVSDMFDSLEESI